MPRNKTTAKKINDHLILHGWLNDQFGYRQTRDLLHDVAPLDEGFTPEGHSPICEFLMSRPDVDPDVEKALPTYDANIKKHLSAINKERTQPIVLRYFQYLALLYAEIFLDWKFNSPGKFLRQLNFFVETRNNERDPGDSRDAAFTETDIEKLAFWMATGAGKTLIMHINYYQYLHYCKEGLDNVVLITPNEGLSEQHILEMKKSGIPCEPFKIEANRAGYTRNVVWVIDIHKLVDEKKGKGVSVPVEAFEGSNLVFVDEGHKGTRSEDATWRGRRKRLAESGFTFEYSATFGQALAAAKDDNLVDEYGKAIAFDYSYRYFYTDGYGKNFRILNVKHDEETQTDTLLLGNLLSFYEQRRYFKENTKAVRAYGLELPLWTFVGGRVNAKVVYKEKGEERSDVLNVIRFLHRFLKNDGNWAILTIGKILDGDSGLRDEKNTDVFHNRLSTLKNLGTGSEQLYTDILKEVFHTDSSGALQLRSVRNASDELALKTALGTVFGLIYIGDTPAFKNLVEKNDIDIGIDTEDVLTESLFSDINKPDSQINILIGAKKFIEGWDSWRVSVMGLLNIGMNEGSQIIQLFGRGVRLRGKDMSLKRSTSEDTKRPPNLPLLETLDIFAVRANFMAKFRDYLEHEDVEHVQLEVPIKNCMDQIPEPLYILKAPRYDEVAKGECVKLDVDFRAKITHTTQSVEIIGSSSQTGIQSGQAKAAHQRTIKQEILEWVNWEKIYLQLLEYKQEKNLHNLIFDTAILRQILCPDQDPSLYELYVMNEAEVMPKTREELERLEELILTLLRKYVTKFYRMIQKRWNDERMELEKLKESNRNFTEKWEISVPQNQAREIQEHITRLVEGGGMYDGRYRNLGKDDYPIVYNDRHLYLPLLAVSPTDTSWHASPPALVESEKDFVEDLFKYVSEQNGRLLAGKQIFLLRNQSRGKGIGFYDNIGFYPDFILWVATESKQRIVFIEPHGMFYEIIDENNLKVNLFKRLHTLSTYERFRDKHVEMDSFIISKTPYEKLRHNRHGMGKQELEEDWHILFREHGQIDYLSPIFKESEHGEMEND